MKAKPQPSKGRISPRDGAKCAEHFTSRRRKGQRCVLFFEVYFPVQIPSSPPKKFKSDYSRDFVSQSLSWRDKKSTCGKSTLPHTLHCAQ